MRKIVSALALLLALSPAAASAQQKLGYVDLQRALNEVDEGKAAKALLKKDFDEKQRQLDGKKAEFDKLQADFEKQATVMSDQAKRDRGQDLERRARELQMLFVNLQKDLSDRERDATRGIFDKMNQIVGEIAEADGFSVVIEKSAGLIYALPSLDLTNELIRKFNARYPLGASKKSEAGASGKKPDAGKKAEGAAGKK